jgi:hypothetical protein
MVHVNCRRVEGKKGVGTEKEKGWQGQEKNDMFVIPEFGLCYSLELEWSPNAHVLKALSTAWPYREVV